MNPSELLSCVLMIPAADVYEGVALNEHPRWDSLAHVQVVTLAEEHWAIPITEQNIQELSTYTGLVAAYQRRRNPQQRSGNDSAE